MPIPKWPDGLRLTLNQSFRFKVNQARALAAMALAPSNVLLPPMKPAL
jgi:hypothetical protein